MEIDKQIKLSVSIVAYCNYDDVLNAIESIEKYTSSDFVKQLYIIDNSCIDSDSEMRRHFEKQLHKYSDVKYINK